MNKFNPINAMTLDPTRRRSIRSTLATARRALHDLKQAEMSVPAAGGLSGAGMAFMQASLPLRSGVDIFKIASKRFIEEVSMDDTIEMCGLLLSGLYTEAQILEFYSLEPIKDSITELANIHLNTKEEA